MEPIELLHASSTWMRLEWHHQSPVIQEKYVYTDMLISHYDTRYVKHTPLLQHSFVFQ